MVVINKIKFIILILLLSFLTSNTNASRILDYETEIFIDNIINEIKKINNINKDFNFVIISDDNINAYVDQNSIIYITSALIENCKDYIALLSVIAHEVGHIEKNHVNERIYNINNLKKVNALSSFSIIAGSMISNNPELLQGLIINSASNSEKFINFSKDQEREADFYSLETLEKLNLYSDSIISLLNEIENKNSQRGITKEKLNISTHPYFDERIEFIKFFNSAKETKLDYNKNLKFKYIRAKFLGYIGDLSKINELDEPFKSYAESIIDAKNGDLKQSMIKINNIISKNKNNIFLLETKAFLNFLKSPSQL